MLHFVSETAKYGDFVSGPRVVNDETRERMKEVLGDIQSGAFARQWIAENQAGKHEYQRMWDEDLAQPIEQVRCRIEKTYAVARCPGGRAAGCPRASSPTSGSIDMTSAAQASAFVERQAIPGARLVVEALEREGVRHIFGYPGGAIMPVYDALTGSNLKHILVRHEQAAALAADAYGRVPRQTGRVASQLRDRARRTL